MTGKMGFLVCHWSAKQIILIYAIDWTDLYFKGFYCYLIMI